MLKRLALLMDIECFSRMSTAAVTEITIVLMDLANGAVLEKLTVFINPYDQDGHIEASTEKWCENNLPQENLQKSYNSVTRPALEKFLQDVELMLDRQNLKKGEYRIYSRGSNFDLPIFSSLYSRLYGVPHKLWDFRSEYCHRTALEIAFSEEELAAADSKAEHLAEDYLGIPVIKHDSYHDALCEGFLLHIAYSKLKTFGLAQL